MLTVARLSTTANNYFSRLALGLLFLHREPLNAALPAQVPLVAPLRARGVIVTSVTASQAPEEARAAAVTLWSRGGRRRR